MASGHRRGDQAPNAGCVPGLQARVRRPSCASGQPTFWAADRRRGPPRTCRSAGSLRGQLRRERCPNGVSCCRDHRREPRMRRPSAGRMVPSYLPDPACSVHPLNPLNRQILRAMPTGLMPTACRGQQRTRPAKKQPGLRALPPHPDLCRSGGYSGPRPSTWHRRPAPTLATPESAGPRRSPAARQQEATAARPLGEEPFRRLRHQRRRSGPGFPRGCPTLRDLPPATYGGSGAAAPTLIGFPTARDRPAG